MNFRLLSSVLLLLGCATARTPAPPPTAVTAPPAPTELPFIENDYARALEEARSRELPLFVDVWAPW